MALGPKGPTNQTRTESTSIIMLNPSIDHCIWIKEKGIAFIFIPKVACTSWKLYLYQLMGNKITDSITYKNVHNINSLSLPYVKAMDVVEQNEFKHALENNELRVCGMIREPKARVLSGYLDKVLHHSNPKSSFSKVVIPAIQRQQGISDGRRPTFKEFLDWNIHTEQTNKQKINDHWRPMCHLLGIGDVSIISKDQIKLWDLSQLDIAVKWFNEIFGRELIFPKSQQLGPRQTNKSESKISDYYGREETEKWCMLYERDAILHKKVIAEW